MVGRIVTKSFLSHILTLCSVVYSAAACLRDPIQPKLGTACESPYAGLQGATRESTDGRHASVRGEDTAPPRISVAGKWLVDGEGRTRIFHGFNAVEKEFPWYPNDLLNETKLDLYRRWGFNAVRLGTMWAGVEPSEGAYNQSYINVILDIVHKLAQRNMHVILDMHQDVISSKFRSYDGIPLWLVNKFPPSPHQYPWPLSHLISWTDGYLTQAVGRVFQNLYDNTAGALDAMGAFWSLVARNFKNCTNVLGYELINEPWAGDIYERPSLLLPGVAGRANLLPVYDRLNEIIRRVDDVTLLFYEPVTWGIVLGGEYTGTGFSHVPGGTAYNNRSVFSFHYYCWAMDYDHQHLPYSTSERIICDSAMGPMVFRSVSNDVTRSGGSLFLTEFGKCDPDGKANSSATVECNFVLEEADKHLVSWTYWDAKFFLADGNIDHNVVRPFTRVFARAVAGTLHAMKFCQETNVFELKFRYNSSISAPTEIFVPVDKYPRGFHVQLSTGMTSAFSERTSTLSISPSHQHCPSMNVTVVVLPKF